MTASLPGMPALRRHSRDAGHTWLTPLGAPAGVAAMSEDGDVAMAAKTLGRHCGRAAPSRPSPGRFGISRDLPRWVSSARAEEYFHYLQCQPKL
jgi:hypothetical protein